MAKIARGYQGNWIPGRTKQMKLVARGGRHRLSGISLNSSEKSLNDDVVEQIFFS